MRETPSSYIGVDTGGTFTDLVWCNRRRVVTWKLPSTPDDFARGVLEGIEVLRAEAEDDATDASLVHSSTVATNAILEGKGSRAGVVTTRGMRDILEIGRQHRPELYQLSPGRPKPLIPRSLRFEVEERISSEGKVLHELSDAAVDRLVAQVLKKNVSSVAVCFLFSFLRPAHEKKVGRALRKAGIEVSLSSEILPVFREVERMSTTVINALVSPVMKKYLRRVQRGVRALGVASMRVVQSNGGSFSVAAAGREAVHTVLSGPAAGVVGALSLARQAMGTREVKCITFDMGGTSTDVALVDGAVQVSTELQLEGYPIGVPMMDIHTVGAGGGSLAYVDAGGGLQVGPESAGAYPGPACYGHQPEATVTDANVVLGRLQPDIFCGGRIPLDAERSRQALDRLAREMDCSTVDAALDVVRSVNYTMERAVRTISVERGIDPRSFTLVSYGGAGGLHVCEVADALGIQRVMVPVNPGVISAWGALCSERSSSCSRTVMKPLQSKEQAALCRNVEPLRAKVSGQLHKEGVPVEKIRCQVFCALRYAGQSFELTVPWSRRLSSLQASFHEAHAQRFGFSREDQPIELVTLRAEAKAKQPVPHLPRLKKSARRSDPPAPPAGDFPYYWRPSLNVDDMLPGPCIVGEDYATTLIPEGWTAHVDAWGHLFLHA